jgi:hypothetical protein
VDAPSWAPALAGSLAVQGRWRYRAGWRLAGEQKRGGLVVLDLSNFAEVDLPQRVLIDWDYAAHGIWKIPSAEVLSALAPGGSWAPRKDAATGRPRPWGDVLSSGLLDALQDWNDTGETLLGPRREPSSVGPELERFWALAAELAHRTQQELGAGYEALYQTAQGAWRWVLPPAARTHR